MLESKKQELLKRAMEVSSYDVANKILNKHKTIENFLGFLKKETDDYKKKSGLRLVINNK